MVCGIGGDGCGVSCRDGHVVNGRDGCEDIYPSVELQKFLVIGGETSLGLGSVETQLLASLK